MMHKVTDLQPWECLMKRIVWKQLEIGRASCRERV